MPKVILCGNLIINNDKILLLFRDKHQHYETPGGKLNIDECVDINNPTIEEIKKAALRELFEELGNDIVVSEPEFFGAKEFIIPDGREAIANKFIIRIISGTPRINEPEIFSKLEWLPIAKLEEFDISPDLRLFARDLK